jgi:hypothetical protein
MKFIQKFFNSSLLTPIFFALFPIFSVWAANSTLMGPLDALHALLMAVIAAIALFFILRLILKNPVKAGLISALVMLLYFSYGQIFLLIRGIPAIGIKIARQRIMLPLWGLILAAGVFLIIKYWKKLTGFALYLNIIGVVLLCSSGIQIGIAQTQENAPSNTTNALLSKPDPAFNVQQAGDKANFPDIYLIVIDSYSRDDIILDRFHYDNSPFSQALTNMGFVVPKCSMSNYTYTAYSMSSMLNMNYLEAFYPKINPNKTSLDNTSFQAYIRNSLVRKNLTELGYKTVSFEMDYPWVEIPDADYYYRSISARSILADFLTPSDFDTELNQTTILSILDDASAISPEIKGNLSVMQRFENYLEQKVFKIGDKKYYQILDSLDNLEKLAKVPGPKFVYIHSTGLHGDFVLGPTGQFQLTGRVPGYENALIYMDNRMLEILPKLINDSRVPPIIILMGDHGVAPVSDARLSNYQAIYMPGNGKNVIYPSITPVNTFRLIFNTYFNAQYRLLKDISYSYDHGRLFNFYVVPPSCAK